MPQGNNNKRRAAKINQEQRMNVIAPLWRRCCTYKEIQAEVKRVLGFDTYSISTVCKDVNRMLKEWRKERLEDVEDRVTSELARLDEVIREAWLMWEKSKENWQKYEQRDKGVPRTDPNNTKLTTRSIESIKKQSEMRGEGDPRYLDVILRAMQQRTKLLGLDQTTIDIGRNLQGAIEIRYIDAGVPCATSEEEVRTREGLI